MWVTDWNIKCVQAVISIVVLWKHFCCCFLYLLFFPLMCCAYFQCICVFASHVLYAAVLVAVNLSQEQRIWGNMKTFSRSWPALLWGLDLRHIDTVVTLCLSTIKCTMHKCRHYSIAWISKAIPVSCYMVNGKWTCICLLKVLYNTTHSHRHSYTDGRECIYKVPPGNWEQ